MTEENHYQEKTQLELFLGNQYRPIDNLDIIEKILPIIKRNGGVIKSSNITETNLYIHAAFPEVKMSISDECEITKGIVIRNSEVGVSSFKIQPWVQVEETGNGIIVVDTSIKRYHVGKSHMPSDLAYEIKKILHQEMRK